jgi:hypothetical protein
MVCVYLGNAVDG